MGRVSGVSFVCFACFWACLNTSVYAGQDRPFEGLGGAFSLVDQYGENRSEHDTHGRMQLLFFGYAHCQQICSSVLPQMGRLVEALGEKDIAVQPVMITIDPERDTQDVLAQELTKYHDDFIGLTGDDARLEQAYRAFQIERQIVFEDPEWGPVYAHGSFLYLLSASGQVLTLLPPVLSDTQISDIIAKYQ